jgi:hypothetical protein
VKKGKSTQFQKGQSGNPLGRPTGSRNKLSETFVTDLQSLWEEQGFAILQRVADEHPEKLLAAMVQVLPKDFQVSIDQQNVKWVINQQPHTNEIEWRTAHNLPIESDT